MHKIVSGTFLAGLTMDDYYPDLRGHGLYEHPDSGGPFDTGVQVGANAQLFGVIPSPCLPEHFHLEQQATPTRFRIGGRRQPSEGRPFDDLARVRSVGRDTDRAPFRRDFLGGDVNPGAPLGYIISMADPPSLRYRPGDNIELDRRFVTSLVGPGGAQSVTWTMSTRVASGRVTRNTIS